MVMLLMIWVVLERLMIVLGLGEYTIGGGGVRLMD